ncbi:hypothetical protein OESDEN_10825 [Oesophagostomum dentatum]|uniref:Uncharacterized protein n=1 Tax=Oesophagostomum dentatum TaxID=61180 RepID=A0A0B1T0R2_OESDE|nr:hypothetical protein OESDEN_10825 [Oesophagostomum dentatum]
MEDLMEVLYGYPPPITYNQDVLPLNKRVSSEFDRKFNADELPIENEQEFSRGDVYVRQETPVFQRSEASRNVTCLFDCISNHVLDMNLAARFIYEQKINNQFDEAGYKEFVRSDCADNALAFRFDGLDFLEDTVLESRLNNIALRLMTEIHCAKVDKLIRLQQITSNVDPLTKRITLSPENLTKEWFIDGPAPFARAPLHELVLRHRPKESGSTLQMLTCMYRFMLTKITDPPDAIKTYSVRQNGRNGKCESLINLPSGVEATLLDFAEDLAGYGRSELRGSTLSQLDGPSSFFMSLGDTPEQRTEAFNELLREKACLRKELFKALQIALKDVRQSKYDPATGHWTPNDRKAKRPRLQQPAGEENLEPVYE